MKHSPRFLELVEAARGRVRECTVDDVKGRLDRGEAFVLVDVREDGGSRAASSRRGAPRQGGARAGRRGRRAGPRRDVVIYCGGGYRSVLAAESSRGWLQNVTSMDGGYRGWTEKGYPTEGG